MSKPLPSAWYWSFSKQKAHYFDEGHIVPLCGRRLKYGMRADKVPEASKQKCPACSNALAYRDRLISEES